MARCHSATAGSGRTGLRSVLVRLALPVAATALLAGCGGVGLPTAEVAATTPSQDAEVTAAAFAAGGDPSDWDAVRLAAPEAFARPGGSAAWYNPLTGTNGTLASLSVPAAGGDACRAFTATMNDWRGVRRYRGEACLAEGGEWDIVAAVAEDSGLI